MISSSPGDELDVPDNLAPYNMTRPYVIRSEASAAVDDDENLPLGAQMTGAKKLRESGLTGKGVRVGVIDSGIGKYATTHCYCTGILFSTVSCCCKVFY